MGAYLNKPKTEKETEAAETDSVAYAATTMQGWRVNQEDAHNCILDFSNGWHLFAVYDGHGGAEVAKYTAQNFPEFLKQREFWSAENITKLLEDTFIEFDDVLRSEPVMKELKKLSLGSEAPQESGDEDEDNPMMLYEESTVPLESLLAKYGYQLVRNGPNTKTVRAHTEIDGENVHVEEDTSITLSIRANKPKGEEETVEEGEEGESSGSTDKKHKRPSASPHLERAKRAKSEKSEEGADDEQEGEKEETKKEEQEGEKEEAKKDEQTGESKAEARVNGEAGEADDAKPPAGGFVKRSNAVPKEKKMHLPADADVSSSDDDDYKEGEESGEAEDEGDDEEEEESGEEAGDNEEGEDEELAEDAFDGLSGASFGPSGETPGEDSGTTACVCFVAPGRLVVANAGDSRAVLCREGRAIDLSVDHKPEDDVERERIAKAGGVVNEDGRVNGGLNLSRAFGDHCYKKNKLLSLREQMISALPDVRIEERTPQDEFVVVACDGIWNSLESQQVVDFVRERMQQGKPLTQICEEMCTACLADSTAGDGTGCDNMTVVIADLRPQEKRKPAEKEAV